MSNKENPCAGYLIEAAKLEVFVLPTSADLPSTTPWRNMTSRTFSTSWTKPFPMEWLAHRRFSSSADTDTGDGDLEEGVPYAFFDEDDLYEQAREAGPDSAS